MSTAPAERRQGGPKTGRPAATPGTADSPAALRRITDATLRAAAERVASDWRSQAGEALDEAEVVAGLVALARTIADPDQTGTAPGGLPAVSVLHRRLLELLRAEVIRLWSAGGQPPDPAAMLRTLGAFEYVRRELEPDWSQYFASTLLGPDGLQLVVEVAHDLRSPLTSILFLSETLRRGQSGEVNDIQRRQLGIIYSAALGLISVASDVIELARGGERLAQQDAAPFSVTQVLESVRDIVLPMAEEKGLAIKLVQPASDQRLGNPVALSRVLLNLTTNALKFTDEGYVEISARGMGMSRIEFSVRDRGNGIDAEVIGSLFRPFRRQRGRGGHAFSGSGLGLTISRKLVETMGSELRFETRPNWGTRFFFELDLPATSPL